MRRVERLLIAFNILIGLAAGWRADPLLLSLPFAGFAAYVYVQDRAVRMRIGPRHWPSPGFARFTLGTNLFFAFWNTLLGAALFALVGTAHAVLGV